MSCNSIFPFQNSISCVSLKIFNKILDVKGEIVMDNFNGDGKVFV